MATVRFRADYGGRDYVATDVYQVESVQQMEGDSAFSTLRIWYSDPAVDDEDFEILEEAFIEEALTNPSYPDRDQFTVQLAKSYSDDDIANGEGFQNIEYCRRYYPGGAGFELVLIGEEVRHSFREVGPGGEIEYSEIVGLQVE